MKKLFFILLIIFLYGCSSDVYDVNHYRSRGFREQRPFVMKQKVEDGKRKMF